MSLHLSLSGLRRFLRTAVPILLSVVVMQIVQAQPGAGSESREAHDRRMEWWRGARFGLFLHWGLYSVPAGEWHGEKGYGEWIRNSAQIPLDEYNRFVGKFNPVKFDAASWVRMAKDAGMKYIVITTKHHDGFCMFDTRQTGFSIMSTPFARDPLAELAQECRRNGIRLCFYYSIMDWHHPDYLPRREWEKDRPTAGADFSRYISYMKAELKELLTNYGDIGVLWFDGEWESSWNHDEGNDLFAYVRSLQPGIIVNNRVGAGRTGMSGLTKEGELAADFGTPEQEIPATGIPGLDWETCMTMNDHWGFNRADTNFKPASELIQNLADIVSKGGNYLLNVGPTAEGEFPAQSVARLRDIGTWMKVNGPSIYGTHGSPFSPVAWGRCTEKLRADGSATLYFHIFHWPAGNRLVIAGLGSAPSPRTVRMLDHPDIPLDITRSTDTTIISLPGGAHDTVDAVVAADFPAEPLVFRTPVITSPTPFFVDSLAVTVENSSPGAEIRYTLDGTIPGAESPLYHPGDPIVLTRSAALHARLFYRGSPVSATAAERFDRADPAPGVSGIQVAEGVRYSYFEGDWDSLPDFSKLKPVVTDTAAVIGVQIRRRDEFFGCRFTGYLDVPVTGVYRFDLSSDDGSRCLVGGKVVVDNDGLHGSTLKTGFAALARGLHPLTVDYFNKTGGRECVLSVSLPSRGNAAVKYYYEK
ncbi:MAG TPA: alpha-L-fucosidase [Bacteroidota bacterium]|nr:alpha-L-fucosidase [Bacteroidota bacterium]